MYSFSGAGDSQQMAGRQTTGRQNRTGNSAEPTAFTRKKKNVLRVPLVGIRCSHALIGTNNHCNGRLHGNQGPFVSGEQSKHGL